ncbi:MAG: sugar phosphate isomerase/epimerase [Thermoplasmata archaeon]|nr:sugar phosphate isomerase/epimerase [Thermoplasmata archaeon]
MIGVASPAFCFSQFEEALEAISKRFSLWEVLIEGEHRLDVAKDAMQYASDSYDMSFQVHAPMSDVNIGSVYEPMRAVAVKEIVGAIEACRELGASLITVHPGFIHGIAFLAKDKVVVQTKRSLAELAPVAADNSVNLAVENMPKGINATCITAKELIEVIAGPNLGVCFDMGHANTAGQIDDFLRHAELILNVHLHNNDGTWDQHNAIDEGTADVAAVLDSIDRSGYSGNYIIEANDLESAVGSKDTLTRLLELSATS